MTLVAIGPPKRCRMCGEMKPRKEFYAHRARNGRVYAMGYCKPCSKARVTAGQQANPERTQATLKRYRENRKRDPERMAIHRDQQREYARRKRGTTPDRYRVGTSSGHAGGRQLDAAPFVAWLRTLGRTATQIAAVTGMDYARVRMFLNGANPPSEVYEDTVDRACLHAGVPIEFVYPLATAA